MNLRERFSELQQRFSGLNPAVFRKKKFKKRFEVTAGDVERLGELCDIYERVKSRPDSSEKCTMETLKTLEHSTNSLVMRASKNLGTLEQRHAHITGEHKAVTRESLNQHDAPDAV